MEIGDMSNQAVHQYQKRLKNELFWMVTAKRSAEKMMKNLSVIILCVLFAACSIEPKSASVQEGQANLVTQKECLAILTNSIPNIAFRTAAHEKVLPIAWVTVESAQMCSRPLDLYLKDMRIGAFLDWSGFDTSDDIEKLYPELKSELADALKSTRLPKTRILIAGEAEYPYEKMKLQNKAIDSDKK